MYRKKQTSRVLEQAELRFSGLKAIDPSMDFGDARNLSNMMQLMEKLRTKIDAYNTALIMIDSSRNEIKELEKTLGEFCERMLLGVAVKYGKDSCEYEMAGGVRKSERIRRSKVSRLKAVAEKTSGENTQTA